LKPLKAAALGEPHRIDCASNCAPYLLLLCHATWYRQFWAFRHYGSKMHSLADQFLQRIV